MKQLTDAEIILFDQKCVTKLNYYLDRYLSSSNSNNGPKCTFAGEQLGRIYSLVAPLEKLVSLPKAKTNPYTLVKPFLRMLAKELAKLCSDPQHPQAGLLPQQDIVFKAFQVGAFEGSDAVVYATLDAHNIELSLGVAFEAETCKVLSCDDFLSQMTDALDAQFTLQMTLEQTPVSSEYLTHYKSQTATLEAFPNASSQPNTKRYSPD